MKKNLLLYFLSFFLFGIYTTNNGTSSSAAFVSGVCAGMKSINKYLSPIEIKNILINTSDKIGESPYNSNSWNQYLGYGRINANYAYSIANGAPYKPSNISSTWYLNHPKISWDTNNEENIDFYQVWKEVDGSGRIVATIQHNPQLTTHYWVDNSVTKPGRFDPVYNYKYKVRAINTWSRSSLYSQLVSVLATGGIWKPNNNQSAPFMISSNFALSKIDFNPEDSSFYTMTHVFDPSAMDTLKINKYDFNGGLIQSGVLKTQSNGSPNFSVTGLTKSNIITMFQHQRPTSTYLYMAKANSEFELVQIAEIPLSGVSFIGMSNIFNINENENIASWTASGGGINIGKFDSNLTSINQIEYSNGDADFDKMLINSLNGQDFILSYIAIENNNKKIMASFFDSNLSEIRSPIVIAEGSKYDFLKYTDSTYIAVIGNEEEIRIYELNQNAEILREELISNDFQLVYISDFFLRANENGDIILMFTYMGETILQKIGDDLHTLGEALYLNNSDVISTNLQDVRFSEKLVFCSWLEDGQGFLGVKGLIFNIENPPTATEGNNNLRVTEYKLYQNYPNPFNPTTKIKFSIPSSSVIASGAWQSQQSLTNVETAASQQVGTRSDNVRLVVYNTLGQQVAELVNKPLTAGNYEVEFNAANLPSGIYFYRLQSGSFVETKKMILLK